MLSEQEIRSRVAKYHWYHIIQLTDTISTPGWEGITPLIEMIRGVVRSLDLKGKRVLDIGCRDGQFSFEAEKQGASEVIGIDCDLSAGATEFLIPYFQSRVRMHELNVLALKPETFGRFDVVLFPGVLYHLRYPTWCLKLVRDVLKENGTLLLETAVVRDNNEFPLLYCPIGDESPYEPTSCTFYNVKGLTDTLLSLGLSVERIEFLDKKRVPPPVGAKPRPAPIPATASLKDRLSPLTDRAALVCQFRPALINPVVDRYWHGTHKIHTHASWDYAESA
jgi:SAM-dependent methyltransferase